MKIGFIGTGVMGASMVRNLMKQGYELHIYNRTKSKADTLVEAGAIWHDEIRDLVPKCDVVMTMVGYPSDVEEVYFSEAGIIPNAKKGTIFIDFTTSTPTLAVKIYEAAKAIGCDSLDAPVTGGDVGAREARLVIMVGGDQSVFEKVTPLFNALGNNVIYHGQAGNGQHTKMCNQIGIAASVIGMSEMLIYADKAGLDLEKVLQSVSTGSAGSWSLLNLAPRVLKENYDPGFYIKHFIKDLNIALNEAEHMDFEVPGASLVKSMYDELAAQGKENLGTQALYLLYKEKSSSKN